MKNIGKRLRELRVERGLTQQGLAASVSGGLDYTYIGKIERGEQSPSLKILTRLGAALDVPLGDFFRDDEACGPIAAGDLAPLPDGRAKRELIRTLRQLHPEDLPLATAIIDALNHHRRTDALARSADPKLQCAAEEEAPYGEKKDG